MPPLSDATLIDRFTGSDRRYCIHWSDGQTARFRARDMREAWLIAREFTLRLRDDVTLVDVTQVTSEGGSGGGGGEVVNEHDPLCPWALGGGRVSEPADGCTYCRLIGRADARGRQRGRDEWLRDLRAKVEALVYTKHPSFHGDFVSRDDVLDLLKGGSR